MIQTLIVKFSLFSTLIINEIQLFGFSINSSQIYLTCVGAIFNRFVIGLLNVNYTHGLHGTGGAMFVATVLL